MAAEEQIASNYNIAIEAIKLILSGGLGGAIVSIVGKVVIDRKLQNQKADQDKQLASLKSQLEKKNTVHKLQFEKEFQLYTELWPALYDVKSKSVITPIVDAMPEGKSSKEVYEERFKSAADAFNRANALFIEHRPFYHEDVSDATEGILGECKTYILKVKRKLSDEEIDSKTYDAAEELFTKLSGAMDNIEKKIQKRIGLLQEAKIVE